MFGRGCLLGQGLSLRKTTNEAPSRRDFLEKFGAKFTDSGNLVNCHT